MYFLRLESVLHLFASPITTWFAIPNNWREFFFGIAFVLLFLFPSCTCHSCKIFKYCIFSVFRVWFPSGTWSLEALFSILYLLAAIVVIKSQKHYARYTRLLGSNSIDYSLLTPSASISRRQLFEMKLILLQVFDSSRFIWQLLPLTIQVEENFRAVFTRRSSCETFLFSDPRKIP